MRLFVALEVPDEVRRAVDAAVAPLRRRWPRLRWTQPDGWHLTLAFLGEVDPLPSALTAALRVAAAPEPARVSLQLTGAGRFGARVLWLGVSDEPTGAVAALGDRLQRAAADLGVDVDRREVRPHLTLARARGREARITQAVSSACPEVDATWDVDRAVLFRSHLGTGPAHGGPTRYEPLASLPLGTSG